MTEFGAEPIAIIGMSARVPGAGDLSQFWRNLVDGVESVTVFTREEQLAQGVTEAELANLSFVPAMHVLQGMEDFDAAFFGMTAREAELADPQQRLFLEQSHAALVDAGYDPERYDGEIGVYGGAGPSQYQWLNLRTNPRIANGAGDLGLSVGNNPDYVATTVSYRLNLRGPSLTVATACSTSLVAVHLACEALRGGECDMALAGGVCVELPHHRGYAAMDGYTSPSGHVRPFDAGADGTMWGSGVGVVTLKRLDDAIADGDQIRAVILGNAINNDGTSKIGFSAPSVQGQAEVIAQALGVAGVDPRTIGYVEAHGTGTALGDPIELSALTAVYGRDQEETGWCGVGSVKSNLGHLSQASGVVGLIKTVLSMEHGLIPPSINYERPNPAIDFDSSPFYVVSSLTKWEGQGPKRAAVSSFGIGGTNAHVVLQEAPPVAPVPRPLRPELLQLSARTPEALETMRSALAERLEREPDLALADVAFTLRSGRKAYPHRLAVLADDAHALNDRKRCHTGTAADPAPSVAFLFSGQGAQYAGMGAAPYAAEPVFAAAVDRCAELLLPELGEDIRPLIFGTDDDPLRQTRLAQPALFTVEYALATLWQEWGVRPSAMIGHSIGEYVAATLAGVFSLPDALRLVAARGRLMQSMPPGSMLAVQRDAGFVASVLPEGLSIATVNGPGTCVVAGPAEAVEAFAERLRADKVRSTPLRTSHAFHSVMMEPILEEFTALVAAVPRRAPEAAFLSNVTGQWITAEQAVDPAYWARHLREPVLFGDCVATLLAEGSWALLECGPGKQLSSLARMQLRDAIAEGALAPMASLPGPSEQTGDLPTLYGSAARLWVAGVPVELGGAGRRVSLPGYPYERKRHFVEPGAGAPMAAAVAPARTIDDWFEVPVWHQVPATPAGESVERCVAFVAGPRGARLCAALRAAGAEVVEVRPGERFAPAEGGYTLRPGARDDYDALVAALSAPEGSEPGPLPRVLHAWALEGEPAGTDVEAAERAQEHGLFSLLLLVQALAAAQVAEGVRIDVLTEGTEDVLGGDLTRPEHATVAGITRVAPLEIAGLTVGHLDLDRATPDADVLAELRRPAREEVVALRAGRRWQRRVEPVAVPAGPVTGLREGGRYLITGGMGGIGITLAEEFGTRFRARLVLLGRTGLPPREEWDRPGDGRTARAVAAIRRIEAAGGQVTITAADVTDPVRLRAVMAEVVAAYGGLDGIVHAAGLPGGGMAEVKELDQARAVLAPKLAGTLALWQAVEGQDLDFVALCSSVTSLTGGFGQVDYCAANAFLDAYARSARGPRVLSLNWGAWREVGMAAEARGEAAAEPLEHPVLRTRSGHLAKGLISAETHWVLDEHRIGQTPVLPATAQLECARAAFAACVPAPGEGYAVELSDVVFTEPLAVREGSRSEVVVSIGGDGRFEVAADGRTRTAGSAAWVRPETAAKVDPALLRDRMRPAVPADEGGAGEGRVSALTFGPHWREPEQTWRGDGEELALVTATHPGEEGQWVLHPALLDVATSFSTARGNGAYLPLSYGRLVVRAPLPARFLSHLRHRSSGEEIVAVDLTLLDESGTVLAEIEEFTLRRVDPGALALNGGAAAPTGSGIGPAEGVEAFHRVLAAGLGPQVVISATALAEVAERERRPVEVAAAEPVERDTPYHAPEGALALTLARIWGEVLGVANVGADDDFFDLGGNSLVAVQLIAQVRATLGVKLPMRTLFEAPTVEQMAARVEQLTGGPGPAPEPAPAAIPRLSRR
ncbi:type I polyketide synthase [Nonomuraea africana]|uniref:type I polyketide synthase n=1 Tax=Nonomuraea africana TaxID=46171 RepID=UPI0033CCB9F2